MRDDATTVRLRGGDEGALARMGFVCQINGCRLRLVRRHASNEAAEDLGAERGVILGLSTAPGGIYAVRRPVPLGRRV